MVEKWFDGNLIYIEPCVIPMPSSGQVGWVPGVVPVQSRAAAGEQCWEPRGVVLKLLHLQKFSEQCVPRSWLPSLYRTLTKLQRKNLQNEQRSWKSPSNVVKLMGPCLCPYLSLLVILIIIYPGLLDQSKEPMFLSQEWWPRPSCYAGLSTWIWQEGVLSSWAPYGPLGMGYAKQKAQSAGLSLN